MNLPTSVMITGCDSMGILDQAIDAAIHFEPMSETEVAELLQKTSALADGGKYERFKSSDYFDSTAKHPHWLEDANRRSQAEPSPHRRGRSVSARNLMRVAAEDPVATENRPATAKKIVDRCPKIDRASL
jgi:hypothetical protein